MRINKYTTLIYITKRPAYQIKSEKLDMGDYGLGTVYTLMKGNNLSGQIIITFIIYIRIFLFVCGIQILTLYLQCTYLISSLAPLLPNG